MATTNDTKTFKVKAGFTYSYISIPASAFRPTFLFFHGFPSTNLDWRHQIAALRASGYGIVAPDLLGYGKTDKPADLAEYRQKLIAGHVAEILDHEGVGRVIAVGHDWGVATTTWFVTDYAERCLGMATIAAAFRGSGAMKALDEVNAKTEQNLGYPAFGYWKFFIAPESGDVFNKHLRSAFSLVYPQDPKVWRTDLCPFGVAQAWLEADKILPPPSWMSEGEMNEWIASWHASQGLQTALNWYRAAVAGYNDTDEDAVPDAQKKTDLPYLFMATEADYALPASFTIPTARASGSKVRVETFKTGHWPHIEKAAEVNRLLMQFASEVVQK